MLYLYNQGTPNAYRHRNQRQGSVYRQLVVAQQEQTGKYGL